MIHFERSINHCLYWETVKICDEPVGYIARNDLTEDGYFACIMDPDNTSYRTRPPKHSGTFKTVADAKQFLLNVPVGDVFNVH